MRNTVGPEVNQQLFQVYGIVYRPLAYHFFN